MKLDERKVKSERERLGLSVVDAAKMIGVSANSIVSAEHGRDIRPVTARKIAAGYGATVADLYPGADDPPKAEARLSQLQERRLREVREKFAPMADLLNHYSRTFEEQIDEGSLTQADVDQFVSHATLADEPMGKAYEDELRAIADALDLADRSGERVVRDGISKEQATAEVREATHQHSLMYAALRRFYAVGEALAAAAGDKRTAKKMRDEQRNLGKAA